MEWILFLTLDVESVMAMRHSRTFDILFAGFVCRIIGFFLECRAVFKAGIFCGFQSRNFHFGRLVKRRMGFCSLCGGAARTERWPVGWRQRTTLDPGECSRRMR